MSTRTNDLRPELLNYKLGGVRAFSTTRHGGVSKGRFGELNINPYCGDDPLSVAVNRRLLAKELDVDADHIVMPHQVHLTRCRVITPDFLNFNEEQRRQYLEGFDAVLTQVKGLCIGVSTADCIPLLLYDPVHEASAAVHAGWRGTVARIAEKALATMSHSFGTEPKDVKVVIGPGISLQNFEVGDEVYAQFAKAGFNMERIARRYDKWHIDLPMANKITLQDCGVKEGNITLSGICTYSRVDDFFSARRLGTASGRIYTAIMM